MSTEHKRYTLTLAHTSICDTSICVQVSVIQVSVIQVSVMRRTRGVNKAVSTVLHPKV